MPDARRERMTAETMNVGDVRFVHQFSVTWPRGVAQRILATHEALAASQQEVERLRAALEDQHKATDDLWNERTELRAQLAAARDDSARLDWLDAQRENDVAEDGYGGQVLVGCIWRIEAQSMSLRAALDTARSTDAERTGGNHARVP